MGLFDLIFKESANDININEGVERFKETPGAVLVDLRGRDEYAGGHIPSSINIPSNQLEGFLEKIPQKDVPIFIYCRSGGRSGMALPKVIGMGYTKVTNIGGILKYTGEMER